MIDIRSLIPLDKEAIFESVKKTSKALVCLLYTSIIRKLSPENSAIYASLPEGVARQLTLDRDPHGNVQVSLIETEKLLSLIHIFPSFILMWTETK